MDSWTQSLWIEIYLYIAHFTSNSQIKKFEYFDWKTIYIWNWEDARNLWSRIDIKLAPDMLSFCRLEVLHFAPAMSEQAFEVMMRRGRL